MPKSARNFRKNTSILDDTSITEDQHKMSKFELKTSKIKQGKPSLYKN